MIYGMVFCISNYARESRIVKSLYSVVKVGSPQMITICYVGEFKAIPYFINAYFFDFISIIVFQMTRCLWLKRPEGNPLNSVLLKRMFGGGCGYL